jgi:hypothetical protein
MTHSVWVFNGSLQHTVCQLFRNKRKSSEKAESFLQPFLSNDNNEMNELKKTSGRRGQTSDESERVRALLALRLPQRHEDPLHEGQQP